MVQTSGYDFELTVAQAGQKYDLRPDTVVSFAAETAINPGQPLMRGTDPEKQAVISDASSFVGVALFTHTLEQAYPAGGASYATRDQVSVLQKGAVWVTSSVDDVVAGETAYVTAAGAYTTVQAGGLEVGTFITGGSTDNLVVLELS